MAVLVKAFDVEAQGITESYRTAPAAKARRLAEELLPRVGAVRVDGGARVARRCKGPESREMPFERMQPRFHGIAVLLDRLGQAGLALLEGAQPLARVNVGAVRPSPADRRPIALLDCARCDAAAALLAAL